MERLHIPVMVKEVVESLRSNEGGFYVDCTIGMGGHSRAILEADPSASVLGLDLDAEALVLAGEALAPFKGRVGFLQCNYKDVDAWRDHVTRPASGILVDMGMSGYQLKAGRGFSFQDERSLDMRMDPGRGEPAVVFLNAAEQGELERVFRRFCEEPHARRIAAAIVRRRAESPLKSAAELARLVEEAVPFHMRRGRVHPATRIFQALRIHVNDELSGLDRFLREALDVLEPGGRLAVLAYHSLEDRQVKKTFRDLSRGCICPPRMPVCGCGREPLLRLTPRRAIKAGVEELDRNPSARSARLRVGVKT